MHADVPPYFFSIVNAVRFDQQFDVIVIIFDAVKNVRYAGSREFIKDLRAERLIARIPGFPERGVGR